MRGVINVRRTLPVHRSQNAHCGAPVARRAPAMHAKNRGNFLKFRATFLSCLYRMQASAFSEKLKIRGETFSKFRVAFLPQHCRAQALFWAKKKIIKFN